MDSNTSGSGVVGQLGLNDDSSEFNGSEAQIDQALGKLSTIKLVKVIAVNNTGALAAVGFVDIKPMVNLVDGLLGSSMQHGTIFNVPYFRLQGGKNAIIIDPEVGDIGYAAFADRDISSVKETKDFANPGSFRRFSAADALYVGGYLNDVPEQYIQMNSDGVTIADKNGGKLEMKSDGLHYNKPLFIDGTLNISGGINALTGGTYSQSITTSGDVVAGTISLKNHVHIYQRPSSGAVTPTPTAAPTP